MASERYPLQDRTAVVIAAAAGDLARELCLALDAAGARVIEADLEVKLEELGAVDVLVVQAPASDATERCCESFASEMSRRKRGSIVLVAQQDELPGAIASRCQSMASRWERGGVRVNSLEHGTLDRRPDPHFAENYGDEAPVGPDERRREYRAALVFLASDASSTLTGFNVVADGSWMETSRRS
jgi:hypothetical protein